MDSFMSGSVWQDKTVVNETPSPKNGKHTQSV